MALGEGPGEEGAHLPHMCQNMPCGGPEAGKC